ncbi:unnamed protein product [Dibothriocephalus latus]|uniref:FACT complex subunit n=1 Tax=Dibothriocephalus latus TaxID=60516 RepID=A0A3P7LBL1_DIBLA|nr:unnamed protein product [Dibothriocephalus latus]
MTVKCVEYKDVEACVHKSSLLLSTSGCFRLRYDYPATYSGIGNGDSPESSAAPIDAFLVVNGKSDVLYSKTVSLQTWLFGYEMQDTAILFTKSGLYILSSKKKTEFLKGTKTASLKDLTVTLLTRTPENSDKENISKLANAFASSGKGQVLGHFIKEKFESEFAKACGEAVKSKAKECVDASNKVSHQSLSDGCQDALKNKEIIKGFQANNLEMCYDPIIQSGGNYALKFSVESFATGIEFRDGCQLIGPKSTSVFRKGMSVNVNIGFQVSAIYFICFAKLKPLMSLLCWFRILPKGLSSIRCSLVEYFLFLVTSFATVIIIGCFHG